MLCGKVQSAFLLIQLGTLVTTGLKADHDVSFQVPSKSA